MGIWPKVRAWFFKRKAEKITALLQQIDQEIRDFAEQNKADYFSVTNAPYLNADLFEREVWRIRQIFAKYKIEIAELCGSDVAALAEFQKAEKNFIRRAKLWHEFRKRGVGFPEEQMQELLVLETRAVGQDRKGRLDEMTQNFKVRAQFAEKSKEEAKLVLKNAQLREGIANYIGEMQQQLRSNSTWSHDFAQAIAIVQQLGYQREELQQHVRKSAQERLKVR